VPFQYLAQPLPILKGRLIGAALLALWYGGTHFSKTLLLIVLGVGALLAPWVLVRSAAFNARYSSYRNFTFDFDGSYGAAAGTLVLAGLETVLSCGLGYPWALARVRRFMLTHTSFGGVRGAYTARGGHLIGPYLLLVVSGGLAAAVVGLLTYFHVRGPVGVGLAYVAYGVGYANFQARLANINWRYSSLGPLGFEVVYEGKDFIWLYLTNALAIVGSFGLLAPWASIRMYRYRIERFAVSFHGSTQVFEGQEGAAVRAAGAEVADLFDFDLSL
jgi:uncharacterized membrane protein YjgN (DUF898 family)